MSLKARLAVCVRRVGPVHQPDNTEDDLVQINHRGELVVALGLPPRSELVRQGNTWQVRSPATAAPTAVPTRTAGLSLWNGEPDMCCVIDRFSSSEEVADATQADTTAIFAMVNAGKVTAPTDAGISFRSTIGRRYGGRAKVAVGAPATNDGWFPHGPQPPLAPAVAGIWKVNDIQWDGYIVSPGCMFSIVAVKVPAASSQQFNFITKWRCAIGFDPSR